MYQTCDVFVTHSHGWISNLIEFGQHRRLPKEFAHWTHAGVIIDEEGGTLEAQAHGIVQSKMWKHKESEIFRLPFTDAQRKSFLDFAWSCEGDPYDFLDDASIGVDLLTPNKLNFRMGGALICSEFAAKCLEHTGWICPKVDTSHAMPGELAMWLKGYKVS